MNMTQQYEVILEGPFKFTHLVLHSWTAQEMRKSSLTPDQAS